MTSYKNHIPAFWKVFTGILAIGILFMVWLMYFFMVRASDAGKFIVSPFILCAFLSLFALFPFFFLWAANSTSYEIGFEGLAIIAPLGRRGLWPYTCITSVRKITMSQLSAESLTNALKRQYLGSTLLPENLLPAWLSPEPRVIVDTSVSGFIGWKFTLITNPENMDQFLAELTAKLASKKQE